MFCLGNPKSDPTKFLVWYTDCGFVQDSNYKDFYQPIANLKAMRVTNVPGIIKNMGLFLKRALYDARGNKRLQKSLFLLFLANAHAPIALLFCLYYSTVFVSSLDLFLNGLFHLQIMERLVLVHFAFHTLFNFNQCMNYFFGTL